MRLHELQGVHHAAGSVRPPPAGGACQRDALRGHGFHAGSHRRALGPEGRGALPRSGTAPFARRIATARDRRVSRGSARRPRRRRSLFPRVLGGQGDPRGGDQRARCPAAAVACISPGARSFPQRWSLRQPPGYGGGGRSRGGTAGASSGLAPVARLRLRFRWRHAVRVSMALIWSVRRSGVTRAQSGVPPDSRTEPEGARAGRRLYEYVYVSRRYTLAF
mmetsp:Transcript_28426/g.91056  ORF Transcript_28426/g.91056 Transcript_28426/m.91056 type:complete len:220 (+) Transcript_28426:1028-1687(+)